MAGNPVAAYRANRYTRVTRRIRAGFSVGRSVAQPGSALASGARGREFESPHSDQYRQGFDQNASTHRILIGGLLRGDITPLATVANPSYAMPQS